MPGVSNSPDYGTNLAIEGADAYGASGAIAIKKGSAVLTPVASPPGALNMTLALPTSGTDDGKILTIYSLGGYAHTITTPTNGVNGANHLITFSAAALNYVTLLAWQGSWYVKGSANATVS